MQLPRKLALGLGSGVQAESKRAGTAAVDWSLFVSACQQGEQTPAANFILHQSGPHLERQRTASSSQQHEGSVSSPFHILPGPRRVNVFPESKDYESAKTL